MSVVAPPASSVASTRPASSNAGGAPAHAWEDTTGGQDGGPSSWETAVQEDAQGRLVVTNDQSAGSIVQAIRHHRRRLKQNDYALRHQRLMRDMIRYVYVVLDASRWMRVKDPVLPPGTRLERMLVLLQEFVHAFFDENPLSHLGLVLAKDGEAELLSALSSNAKTHVAALQSVVPMLASTETRSSSSLGGGEFSLQNALEVAGRSLGHQPAHGSREIVVLTAALSTSDPGSLLTDTMPRLQQAHIRVSCLSLAAEVHILQTVATATHGSRGVALDTAHVRAWLRQQTVPPPRHKDAAHADGPQCDMVPLGFPTRTTLSTVPVPIHAGQSNQTIFGRTAYVCPQCQAKNADLPTDCAVCGLKLVLSPHLARSFHHLFPVPPFAEVVATSTSAALPEEDATAANNNNNGSTQPTQAALSSSSADMLMPPVINSDLLVHSQTDDSCCVACLRRFVTTTDGTDASNTAPSANLVTLRFACPNCSSLFCVDCDVFLHESLHNCPGCLVLAK